MQEVHLSTVKGESNVLTVDIKATGRTKQYCTLLTQVATGAPTQQLVTSDIDSVVWSRTGIGVYQGLSVGLFAGTIACLIGSLDTATLGGSGMDAQARAYKGTDDKVIVETTWNDVGTVKVSDDFLKDTPLCVTIPLADITTDESMFTAVLAELDANQLLIWNKIVIRLNGVVTLVDGKTWRLTADFAESSSVINS